MSTNVQVILDLSDEVQALLDQQGVDLYQDLQQEMLSIRLSNQSDPAAPSWKSRYSNSPLYYYWLDRHTDPYHFAHAFYGHSSQSFRDLDHRGNRDPAC